MGIFIIVSTGGYFGLAFATQLPPRVERFFYVNDLRGKLYQLGLPNLQDIFIGEEASLGLKLASF